MRACWARLFFLACNLHLLDSHLVLRGGGGGFVYVFFDCRETNLKVRQTIDAINMQDESDLPSFNGEFQYLVLRVMQPVQPYCSLFLSVRLPNYCVTIA